MSDKYQFRCKKELCKTECCGAYTGASNTLYPLSRRTFQDIILTNEDLKVISESKFREYSYVDEEGIGHIYTDTDGRCKAFGDGKCLINEVKPTICKAYPLYLDMFIGLCVAKECPAVSAEQGIENYKNEIVSFLKMCEFWMNYYRDMLSEEE